MARLASPSSGPHNLLMVKRLKHPQTSIPVHPAVLELPEVGFWPMVRPLWQSLSARCAFRMPLPKPQAAPGNGERRFKTNT
jgi:hypothetical protein